MVLLGTQEHSIDITHEVSRGIFYPVWHFDAFSFICKKMLMLFYNITKI